MEPFETIRRGRFAADAARIAEIVRQQGTASASMLQRRLRIGYNRAARLIEQMEHAGMVSPMQANGNREVLVPGRGEA